MQKFFLLEVVIKGNTVLPFLIGFVTTMVENSQNIN